MKTNRLAARLPGPLDAPPSSSCPGAGGTKPSLEFTAANKPCDIAEQRAAEHAGPSFRPDGHATAACRRLAFHTPPTPRRGPDSTTGRARGGHVHARSEPLLYNAPADVKDEPATPSLPETWSRTQSCPRVPVTEPRRTWPGGHGRLVQAQPARFQKDEAQGRWAVRSLLCRSHALASAIKVSVAPAVSGCVSSAKTAVVSEKRVLYWENDVQVPRHLCPS